MILSCGHAEQCNSMKHLPSNEQINSRPPKGSDYHILKPAIAAERKAWDSGSTKSFLYKANCSGEDNQTNQ